MLKKLLLSLAALVVMSLSISAETKVLWQSEDSAGKLVEWGAPALTLSAEEAASIKAGDFLTMTVAGVNPENGWPQVALFEGNVGWPPAMNEGVGGKEYPYVVSFGVTWDFAEKIHANGIVFKGDGAYVSAVGLKEGSIEIGPNTVWFGPKVCNWGNGVTIPKEVFADVAPGDKIQFFYEKGAGDNFQFIFGGWDNGLILSSGDFWKISGFDNDKDAGCFNIELTEDHKNFTWGEGENAKEYNLFELLKNGGLPTQGTATINQVLFIPDPLRITAKWWHKWDGVGADAKYHSDDSTLEDSLWDNNVNKDLDKETKLLGFIHDGFSEFYADLSNYLGLTGVATPGTQLLMRFNWGGLSPNSTSSWIEHTVDADNNGNFEFNFDDLKDGEDPVTFVHLNFIKVSMPEGGTIPYKVESINLIPKPASEIIIEDLTADMFYTWDGYGPYANKRDHANLGEGGFNIGNGKVLGGGGLVCGTGGVDYLTYADLTGSSKLIIEGTPGVPLRVLMNRQESNSGPLVEKNPKIGEDGTVELDLTDLSYVHINAIKVSWGGEGSITSIKYDVPNDLKAVFKKILQEVINNAKLYNKFAYTDESFAILQTAITDGESVLNSDNIETLKTAGKKIEDSISGLNLKPGYSYIDKNQFKEYTSNDENPGEGQSATPAYILFKSSDNPYGDPNYLKWNELKEYDNLIITFSGNSKPRALMNRKTAQGNDGDNKESSEMLDMQPDKENWSTEKYTGFDRENNVFTVYIKSIVEDYGFARLHAIRYGNQESGIVTGIYLYNLREHLRESLGKEIENAKMYNAIAYTTASFSALKTAINDGEQEKDKETATVESLAAASNAIKAAIDGLKLEEGYEKLTAEMYKTYNSYDDAVLAEDQNAGAYVLFESTNNPYGTGGSDNYRWADLSAYDKLIVTISGNDKPRIWINRKIDNGQDGSSIEDSNMLDMRAGNGKWSTNKYTTFDSDNNVFTVDLNKIKADYDGVARLHGIKYEWGVNGIVTGMYLYTSTDDLELPLEALRNAISQAEQCDKYLKTETSLNALQTAIDEGKDALKVAKPTVAFIEAATNKILEAIEDLEYQSGYSELKKDMFKKYTDVNNPGEGEAFDYNFKLGVYTDQPLGGSKISELEWAELTNYDKLIFKVKEGALRVLMNRQYLGAQQGSTMADSYMLDMHAGNTDEWSTNRYMTSENDIHTVDLRKIVDDQDFARLNAVKSNCNITAIYLYKDPKDVEGYNLSFNIDDPNHVVIKVDGEEINDLNVGDNEKTIEDRAKLYIASAEGYILKSVKADNEDVTPVMDETHDGSLTKTIVKKISYEITTEKIDPLKMPRIKLKAAIENAELYDGVAKTEESFQVLTDAIDAAKPLMTEDTTPDAIADAIKAIQDAIDDLKLDTEAGYSNLTSDMFKTYASVTEPGDGVDAACPDGTFVDSMLPYGDKQNGYLNWADLSEYDELIITTNGAVGPRFYMNRLEEKGAQAETMEESKMIDIDPRELDSWSYKYLKVDGNKYTVDLKAIVKDHKFARLHSIQPAGYEQTIFITGMYLWKDPTVYVTGISLDKNEATMTVGGEPLTLTATVAPDDATDQTVTWASSDESIATVDNGKVTALKVGKATITATAGDFSAICDVKVYPKVGDANLDGAITITDAVDITNYVVERKVVAEADLEFYLVGANANGEEGITFADASAAAELALKETVKEPEESTQTRIRAFEDESADALVIGRASTSTDGTILPVALDNSMAYVALQADIILPEGMNVDVKAGSRIAGSHSLMTRKHADNHIRVVLFNLSNSAFADNDAPILEIVTDSYISASDIMITTVLASDADAKEYVLAAKTSVSTGVAALGLDENDPIKVYDVNGIYVSDTIEGLQQGTYIVRQGDKAKKVRVR